MPTQVIMPQLGESVVEGTVSRWLKQVGDTVEEYEPLLEVSTDKVDTEVPAPASGVLLQIIVPEGQTVERGTLLAVVGQPGEKAEEAAVPAAAPHSQPAVAPQAAPPVQAAAPVTVKINGSGYTGHITPVVARMVAEHKLDLSQIPGTGRDGRITKKDVEAYLAGNTAAPAPDTDLPPWERPGSGDLFKPTVDYGDVSPAAPAAPKPAAAPAPPRSTAAPIPQGVPGELVRLSSMRRAIAEHMVRSKLHTSPHVTTVFEIDMTAALAHRAKHKADFAKQGVNLTLTAYFAAASVVALQANPYLNAQWTDEGIYLHHAVHLGMAVAMDEGLIVPVIHNAQDLNLMGLARAVNDLSNRGRNRQLKPDEVQGGTFTITNHGVSGSLFAMPIINQPQVGILGVGVMEKRVKVINDAIAIRPCVYASLTFDHRVADGATGDAFMVTLKDTLEGWA
ncbi:MAG: 2-oxo acid dehydrogenase subunit E2 [Anaerolineaceae bacterium]|nr:2-oxo acid dehydrogenase subunit E2 [Anaerolineaceae bacterium]